MDPPSTGRAICVRAAFSQVLPSAASSLLMTPMLATQPAFLVTGTPAGEVMFDPIDDEDRHVQCKVTLKSDSPVTAMAYGDLTGCGSPQVMAISADGSAQCLNPPNRDGPASVAFSQLIQANVTAACILDVDRDGQQELVVIMTDRVLRTFRWSATHLRLLPVNKWEVPLQISAFSIGESGQSTAGFEAWVSQLGASFFVSLPLSEKDKAGVHVVYPPDSKDPSVMIMPYRSSFIYVMGTLINNVIIQVNQKERPLYNPGWPIIAASAVRLPSFNVVATLDLRGLVLIYGFNERNANKTIIEPLLRFDSLSDSERLAAVVTNDQILLAVGNTEGRIIVHAVPVASVKRELGAPWR